MQTEIPWKDREARSEFSIYEDGRKSKTIMAYYMCCLTHGVLIPEGKGETFSCSQCRVERRPDGHYHDARFVAVTFVSSDPFLVLVALEKARKISPAVYGGTLTVDLDIGKGLSREHDERVRREIEDMRERFLMGLV